MLLLLLGMRCLLIGVICAFRLAHFEFVDIKLEGVDLGLLAALYFGYLALEVLNVGLLGVELGL